MILPAGHQILMPYLILENAAQFIHFTKKVFNAEDSNEQILRKDGTIMHAEIIVNGSTIMVTDETKDWTRQTANLFVYVPNADETYKKALENGATNLMRLNDHNYGRTCGITDSFGNVWWITSVSK